MLIENWRKEYNTVRPHSSADYKPPAPEAVQYLIFKPFWFTSGRENMFLFLNNCGTKTGGRSFNPQGSMIQHTLLNSSNQLFIFFFNTKYSGTQ